MKPEITDIHRLLDGDVADGEQEAIIKQIQDHPALKQEFDDLSSAVNLLKREGPMQPPLAFTAAVMRKLSGPDGSTAGRMNRFLFGSRVLRWNMAAAMAIALLTIVTTLFMMKQLTRLDPSSMAPVFLSGEQAAMVRLTFVAPGARSVAVAGNFNKWRTDSHTMSRENGAWTITLPLQPGVYTYMFIVDNEQWVTDPHAETYRDDGFGSQNAVLRVTI